MAAKVDDDVRALSEFLGKVLNLDSTVNIANYIRLFESKSDVVYDMKKILDVQKIAITKTSCGRIYVGVYDKNLFEKVCNLIKEAPNKTWNVEIDAVGFRPDAVESKRKSKRKISA